jgi:hypothetical protein
VTIPTTISDPAPVRAPVAVSIVLGLQLLAWLHRDSFVFRLETPILAQTGLRLIADPAVRRFFPSTALPPGYTSPGPARVDSSSGSLHGRLVLGFQRTGLVNTILAPVGLIGPQWVGQRQFSPIRRNISARLVFNNLDGRFSRICNGLLDFTEPTRRPACGSLLCLPGMFGNLRVQVPHPTRWR